MRKVVSVLISFLIILTFIQPASADTIRDRQYWLNDYGFTRAWNISQGESVLVAIIDTGIDAKHPDLIGAVVGGTDVSGIGSSDGLTPVGSNEYHGTLVASLLAGRGHDPTGISGGGVIGTAPKAELLSISMAFGIEGLDTDAQVAEGIYWAVDNGAKVINLSLTRNATTWPTIWDEAFSYAFENDVVIVAAVGNRSGGAEQASAPATIPGVIAVAGVNKNAEPSSTASTSGYTIAVSAPAEDLVGAYPNGEYRLWSGTSGSAPIVAGLVALIRSKYPEMNAASVINQVILSATGMTSEPYSSQYGYGLIDAERALTLEVPAIQENPLGSLEQWISLYRPTQSEESETSSLIQDPIESGFVSPPLALEPEVTKDPNWFPIAGFLGFGVLALFLYFTFRPKENSQGSITTKRK
jgi:subtilisin family serine protease